MSESPSPRDDVWPPPVQRPPEQKPTNFVKWRRYADADGTKAIRTTLWAWLLTAPLQIVVVVSKHLMLGYSGYELFLMSYWITVPMLVVGAGLGFWGFILGLMSFRSREGKIA